jgi:hypothetical protein
LLNSSNFYGGPRGHPTPNGLLVRFGGILLCSIEENLLFPCRHTTPKGLFYLKLSESWILCKFQAKHHHLIPEQKTGDSYHKSEYEYLKLHSDFNYNHWKLDGSALIFDVQSVLPGFNGERDAAFVTILEREGKNGDPIVVSFEFAMKIWKLAEEVSPSKKELPVVAVAQILEEQAWCVG